VLLGTAVPDGEGVAVTSLLGLGEAVAEELESVALTAVSHETDPSGSRVSNAAETTAPAAREHTEFRPAGRRPSKGWRTHLATRSNQSIRFSSTDQRKLT